MTRLVALALFILSSAGMPQARAGGQSATCASGETNMYRVEEPARIEIACPAPLKLDTRPEPSIETTKVLLAPQAHGRLQPLRKLIPGASYYVIKKVATVLVEQLPEEAVTVYFHCKAPAGGAEVDCFIGLAVQPYKPLGPNGCAVAGSGIQFEITASGQTALFTCSDDLDVLPQNEAGALDETCTHAVLLPKGSILQIDNTGDDLHQFTVKQLPKETVMLCYICVPPDGNVAKAARCEVRIKIRGIDKSGTGSVGVAARVATALGLILPAVAFSHCY